MPLREFAAPGQKSDLKVGDEVEVYVDRVENMHGEAMLSRDRAPPRGRVGQAGGRFRQDRARRGRDLRPREGRLHRRSRRRRWRSCRGQPGRRAPGARRHAADGHPAAPSRSSRWTASAATSSSRAAPILEETRAEQRSGLIQSLHEGQIIEGVVKNITDYGAFVDLGGIDGLLHVTDLSLQARRASQSEALNIGDTVKVQIIRINKDTQRISLGMKQLESDPWDGASSAKYPVGAKLSGRVTNITEYGAFVELEAGIEGLVHVSEMSWTKKNVHPGKIVSTSQEVDVLVLEVDEDKRRISLGLKQAQANPWEGVRRRASGRLAPSRARSRTRPSSACSSGSTTTLTGWSTCRTSPGASRARTRWRSNGVFRLGRRDRRRGNRRRRDGCDDRLRYFRGYRRGGSRLPDDRPLQAGPIHPAGGFGDLAG